ncbi:MAG: dTDP-4-dehydrorhamnose 3,5-epimerase [Cyanobacteriota bacterium]|nr:dTDP-4-dehydrorhamnose 3,5-epimerase [Cyanobacteriota bacterium]
MRVDATGLDGLLLLTPTLIGDDRGFFFESWNGRRFAAALGLSEAAAPAFSQDNHSRSTRGVLRGLHYQLPPSPQGKLVRCVAGEIFDVAVDLRRSSSTYGRWYGTVLSDSNHRQLWIPVGFAHGFLTLSASADVLYKASGYWSRDCERSLLWSDPRLAIAWPLEGLNPQLAAKDAAAPELTAAEAAGDVFP